MKQYMSEAVCEKLAEHDEHNAISAWLKQYVTNLPNMIDAVQLMHDWSSM